MSFPKYRDLSGKKHDIAQTTKLPALQVIFWITEGVACR